jgi:hypothetical protein
MGEGKPMAIEERFQEYFAALDRSGDIDRCYLCCRTPADVKAFFGFHEDGTPIDADAYGIEDVVLPPVVDVMSYRADRPVCAVCQLNIDSVFLSGEGQVLERVIEQMRERREELWPQQ